MEREVVDFEVARTLAGATGENPRHETSRNLSLMPMAPRGLLLFPLLLKLDGVASMVAKQLQH